MPWRDPNITEDQWRRRVSAIAFGEFSISAILSLNSGLAASLQAAPPRDADTTDTRASILPLSSRIDSITANDNPPLESCPTNGVAEPRNNEPQTPNPCVRSDTLSDGGDSALSSPSQDVSTTLVEDNTAAGPSQDSSPPPESSSFPTEASPCIAFDTPQLHPIETQPSQRPARTSPPCSPRDSTALPGSRYSYNGLSLSQHSESPYTPVQAQSIPRSTFSFSERSLDNHAILLYASTPADDKPSLTPDDAPARDSSEHGSSPPQRRRRSSPPIELVPDPATTVPGGRARDMVDGASSEVLDGANPGQFGFLVVTLREQYNQGSGAYRQYVERELAAIAELGRLYNTASPGSRRNDRDSSTSGKPSGDGTERQQPALSVVEPPSLPDPAALPVVSPSSDVSGANEDAETNSPCPTTCASPSSTPSQEDALPPPNGTFHESDGPDAPVPHDFIYHDSSAPCSYPTTASGWKCKVYHEATMTCATRGDLGTRNPIEMRYEQRRLWKKYWMAGLYKIILAFASPLLEEESPSSPTASQARPDGMARLRDDYVPEAGHRYERTNEVGGDRPASNAPDGDDSDREDNGAEGTGDGRGEDEEEVAKQARRKRIRKGKGKHKKKK